MHLTPYADAILYISLISGRNPSYLIGEQVKKPHLGYNATHWNLSLLAICLSKVVIVEPLSNLLSGTIPIPRDKSDIAGPHALAAEYLGMQMVYLEAGSGASHPVPDEMISTVKAQIQHTLNHRWGYPYTQNRRRKSGKRVLISSSPEMSSKKTAPLNS